MELQQTQQLLQRSWQRSRDYGLVAQERVTPYQVSASQFKQRQQRHQLLLDCLQKNLTLFEQLQQGRRCRLLFADSEGTILLSQGDPYFGNKAQQLALANGARWHEQDMGTNAIGTALLEQQAVTILGNQHFLTANQGISCSASPVLAPSGELLGVIDISSEVGEHHQDMLLTARLMALAVENALVVNQTHTHWIVNLADDASSLQQPWAGIIALDADGRLLGANRSARQWLPSLTLPDLIAQLTQGELTPVAHGVALLSRRPSIKTSSTLARKTSSAPCPREATALKLMARQIPLFIHGETGTGKDYLVRRLHQQSQRATQPLIPVNCGALPSELIEAELFGYQAGAFTGGHKHGRVGYIRAAHQGVLFLDEVGELPLSAQTRLLRVLEEKAVTPLGSHQAQAVDFQLLAASHQDLKALVAAGEFRQDLYFRLNGFTLSLPPLRTFSESDFHLLVSRLVAELAISEGVTDIALATGLISALRAYAWPGNIRQLKQQLAVAVVLADGSPLELAHFPELNTIAAPPFTQHSSLQSHTDELLLSTLSAHDGNISATARQLNISRTTVYNRLNKISSSA